MMSADLLAAVHPADGHIAIVGIKNGGVTQLFAETHEEAEQLSRKFILNGYDTYFSVARFTTDENRKRDNVAKLKAFWIDLDCGEDKAAKGKGYATQQDALAALRTFCKNTKLSKPYIVNSGRGIHAYWVVNEELSVDQWEPVAAQLKSLCFAKGLLVDPSVFEAARIMRLPGSVNYKDEEPKDVEVLIEGVSVPFSTICDIVGHAPLPFAPRARRASKLGDKMRAAASDDCFFENIITRGLCQQLTSCYTERAELSEPRWFDALSVAAYCADKDTAIHIISQDHPDYSADATEAKIAHIKGPHACAVFEANNPGGCNGCPFKGKITSPISLGRAGDNKPLETLNEETPDTPKPKLPKAPEGFSLSQDGVYGIIPGEGDVGGVPVLIYDRPLYVRKRMHDPTLGDVAVVHYHSMFDGLKEFSIPNADITDKNLLRQTLAKYGVITSAKQFAQLSEYIIASIRMLQFKKSAEQMYTQFGWTGDGQRFILGGKELSANGERRSPPSSATAEIATRLHSKGTMEAWREVFDLLGRPGMEAHAFGVLAAFGAPLLKFTGQPGVLMNLINNKSGTGKTTVLHLINSVYGHPHDLMAVKDDTYVAKMIKLGVMNNLPYTADEMTNSTPLELSAFAYAVTQGKAKDRGKASSNELRVNTTTWQTIAVCTSNASFYDKLAMAKNSPDGENMRIFEYTLDAGTAIDRATAKEMFDYQLMDNYGHAGEVYIKYVLTNLNSVIDLLRKVQTKIDTELDVQSKERFWSSGVAACITGGLIAKRAGLVNWNMDALYEFATSQFEQLREETKPPQITHMQTFGEFVNRNLHNLLITDSGDNEAVLSVNPTARPRKLVTIPILEPRGDLVMRYEPDSKLLYVQAAKFKEFCASKQISFKDVRKDLLLAGVLQGADTVRLGRGMKLAAPAVYCIVVRTDVPGFMDMDGLTRQAIEENT